MLLCRVLTILCLTVSASQSQGERRPISTACVAWRDVASKYSPAVLSSMLSSVKTSPPQKVSAVWHGHRTTAYDECYCFHVSMLFLYLYLLLLQIYLYSFTYLIYTILPYRQLPWPWIHANNSSPRGVVAVLYYRAQAGRRYGIFVTELCLQWDITVADNSVFSQGRCLQV